MSEQRCPKCKGEMDAGRVAAGDELRYVSNKQTGMVRQPTIIRQALACPACGFVEIYLDAGELRQKLGSAGSAG